MTEPTPHTVDLLFMGHARSIAAYVVPHDGGCIVVDPGPSTCADALDAGLRELGYRHADVTDVLLTHIHFDHAGGAWRLAEAGATVHVHRLGYRHLLDPTRLWQSAARIYGEDGMASLWGEMKPIAKDRLREWGDVSSTRTLARTNGSEGIQLRGLYTPGHAKHHMAWLLGRSLFLGDVGGCRIGDGPVEPPCPPPDIDLELWRESLSKLRQLTPEVDVAYRTHFGTIEAADLPAAYEALEGGLDRWLGYVLDAESNAEVDTVTAFTDAVAAERAPFGEAIAQSYALANPAYMSVTGLLRYLDLKR